ncbi:Auxin-induced protein [Musa troglodytarum]|uniref:Auxin-induced protein n=1 Tax=Musa troglodytarum TaxID=320322 RepID=A0A9E7KD41_9LILI|nr:Auxin-induced protein [Musa troglodytarum]
MGGCDEFMWRTILYIMMIILQFSFIGKYILSRVSLGSGMSQCVLVVFSHAFGTLSMASLAFFLEQPVMNQIFYWPEVYICYLLIHHEQHLAGHDLRGWRAYRVVGTLVIVVGAMLMAIYKGPPMELVWSKHTDSLGSNSPVVTESSSNNWFMGFCFHILSTLASASLSLLWV